ncbi:MAG: hypothetical protein HXX08_07705 [Chloroflexi bacterium]|uniref:PDZ domain-containing protein n=1 Tax=Candidatus Chlorohelix allophototropha TaxID=3003348 RepID=A0A8T7LUN7_9CHLR|nr:hypothetical protein [Chloroflexota bacterium]WJW67617.1 hypothetical protein OZ401_000886 [Chloroflexota bacterium L227-S17]
MSYSHYEEAENPPDRRKYIFALAMIVVGISFFSTLATANSYWQGFFYSPFYTTNVFTDSATPAWQVGLRPEDRVVMVAGQRIDQLQLLTVKAGLAGKSLNLVYELGRVLTAIDVNIQVLDWSRYFEKNAPFLLASLSLIWIGVITRKSPLLLRIFCTLSGVALGIAPNYYLANGCGLESGLETQCLLSGKWSTYLYNPLWSVTVAIGLCWYLSELVEKKRWRLWAQGLVLLALLISLAGFLQASIISANYNNPDYVVWQSRGEFWFLWGSLLVLALMRVWRRKRQREWGLLTVACLLVFTGGFIFVTVFDIVIIGLGQQWYTLALPLYFQINMRR